MENKKSKTLVSAETRALIVQSARLYGKIYAVSSIAALCFSLPLIYIVSFAFFGAVYMEIVSQLWRVDLAFVVALKGIYFFKSRRQRKQESA